jgi:hypothetical protein
MMRSKPNCHIGLAVACLLIVVRGFGIADDGGPQASSKEVLLTIGGEVEPAVRFTAFDLATFERHKVEARDHNQHVASFEGVLLADILQKLGLPFGKQLRGRALTTYLLVEAVDGYRVLFVLPETPCSRTRLFCWLTGATASRSQKRKVRSESWSPTRSARLGGFAK